MPSPTPNEIGVHSTTLWMVLSLDDTGKIKDARGSVKTILGHKRESLINTNCIDLVHPTDSTNAIDQWFYLRTNQGQTRSIHQIWQRADGEHVWLEISFLANNNETFQLVAIDITDRIKNEHALEAREHELAALAEDLQIISNQVPVPVFRCDATGAIEFRNSQWLEMFGSTHIGSSLHEIVHPDFHAAINSLLQDAANAPGTPVTVEVQATDKTRFLRIFGRGVSSADTFRIVGSVSDITATVQLQHEATHDHLTGLANRTQLRLYLEDALEHSHEEILVVFIDLNEFKTVNDHYGHEIGDELLIEIAKRLSHSIRPGDLATRYGGDEFVIVYKNISPRDETQVVKHLHEKVFSKPIMLSSGIWHPSASIGTARPAAGSDVATVLRHADYQMFQQKRLEQELYTPTPLPYAFEETKSGGH